MELVKSPIGPKMKNAKHVKLEKCVINVPRTTTK
jgi:hypothetical protein